MVEPPLSSRAARALRWAALPFAIVLLIAVAAVSYGQVRQFREDLSIELVSRETNDDVLDRSKTHHVLLTS